MCKSHTLLKITSIFFSQTVGGFHKPSNMKEMTYICGMMYHVVVFRPFVKPSRIWIALVGEYSNPKGFSEILKNGDRGYYFPHACHFNVESVRLEPDTRYIYIYIYICVNNDSFPPYMLYRECYIYITLVSWTHKYSRVCNVYVHKREILSKKNGICHEARQG